MQAEYGHIRGNGFIISPVGKPVPQKEHFIPENCDFSGTISSIKEKMSDAAVACSTYTKKASKKIAIKFLSVFLVIFSIFEIFRMFTFATGIYVNSSRIASAKNEADFFNALSDAKAVARNYGINNIDISYSMSPVFSLRAKISSKEALRDEILLSTGLFTKGCSLYIGRNKIFDAENNTVAQAVVKEYIASYSMSDNATLSASPEFRPCIIPKTHIQPKDVCIDLLKSSDSLNVVSVVNATSVKVLPYETITENDSDMYVGDSVTVTEGTNGNIQVFEEAVYENGKPQSVRIASEKITAQPVARVVRVGTKYKKVLESGLIYPLKGVLSSPFGNRWGSVHEGIDIAVEEGTPVKAAECGKVTRVSENAGGYGKLIEIDHGYGVETVYAHLSEIKVSEGDAVSSDTIIGLSGNTGRSTGPHLHFEITQNDVPINPLKHLK